MVNVKDGDIVIPLNGDVRSFSGADDSAFLEIREYEVAEIFSNMNQRQAGFTGFFIYFKWRAVLPLGGLAGYNKKEL